MMELFLSDRAIKTELPAFTMGIINVTDNSFWSGSAFNPSEGIKGAVDRALEMAAAGVDIIDVGGESSRPGSFYVSAEEEIKRVIPFIKELRKHSNIPVSVDTRKKSVMEEALANGADILNDISALEDDAEMVSFCAEKKIPVILMHKRGIPSEMQKNTAYDDILSEVSRYLSERALFCVKNGIEPEKIILDAGIGFGKSLGGNIELLNNSDYILKEADSYLKQNGYSGNIRHILMALSRKTMIGDITGKTVENRMAGTLAANLIAVQRGATMLRVHDAAETCDMLKVLKSLEV